MRLEGLCVLLACILFYARHGDGWGVFVACFLIPDLSLLGYLANPRVGAFAYNAAHSYVGAIICLVIGAALGVNFLTPVALIWAAHIGFDRMLGYGLKYTEGFAFTHLGRIGRHEPRAEMPGSFSGPTES